MICEISSPGYTIWASWTGMDNKDVLVKIYDRKFGGAPVEFSLPLKAFKSIIDAHHREGGFEIIYINEAGYEMVYHGYWVIN